MNGHELEATNCSGNTRPSRPHGRHFQLTLNQIEMYDQLKGYLTGLKNNNYFIACKEVAPTTGHEHIHIYVQFDTSVRLGVTKCCGAHIEMCRGSPQQNVDYIKKDGEILDEIGELRCVGNPTIREIGQMSKEQIKDLPWQMHNTAMKIYRESHTHIKISDIYKPNMEVHYIYGPSEIGKTYTALKFISDRWGDVEIDMVKHVNDFWHDVTDDCDYALLDEFRDFQMNPSEFINFIDYNKHSLNTKGGNVRNNYKFIVITSIQSPWDIYSGMRLEEPRKQWLRRMHKWTFDDDGELYEVD